MLNLEGTKLVEKLLSGSYQLGTDTKDKIIETCNTLYKWRVETGEKTGIKVSEELTHNKDGYVDAVAQKYLAGTSNHELCQTEFFQKLVMHQGQNNQHTVSIQDAANNHFKQLFKKEKKEYPSVITWLENYYKATLDPKHAASSLVVLDEVRRKHRKHFLNTASKVIKEIQEEWLTSAKMGEIRENFESKRISATPIFDDENYADYLIVACRRAIENVRSPYISREVKDQYSRAMKRYLITYLDELVQIKTVKEEKKSIEECDHSEKVASEKKDPYEAWI